MAFTATRVEHFSIQTANASTTQWFWQAISYLFDIILPNWAKRWLKTSQANDLSDEFKFSLSRIVNNKIVWYGAYSVRNQYTKRWITPPQKWFGAACHQTKNSDFTSLKTKNQSWTKQRYRNMLRFYALARLREYPGDMIFERYGAFPNYNVVVCQQLDQNLQICWMGRTAPFPCTPGLPDLFPSNFSMKERWRYWVPWSLGQNTRPRG